MSSHSLAIPTWEFFLSCADAMGLVGFLVSVFRFDSLDFYSL